MQFVLEFWSVGISEKKPVELHVQHICEPDEASDGGVVTARHANHCARALITSPASINEAVMSQAFHDSTKLERVPHPHLHVGEDVDNLRILEKPLSVVH
tara:strand:- start:239 stop:538 length:300 start_codon:yes stop_codon:yes gene_type:complete